MFLYFAFLIYPIILFASLEEHQPPTKKFVDLPTDLLSIIKSQTGTAFLRTHTGAYPQLKTLQQIDIDTIIDDIARKNLFEENYSLNIFNKGYNKDYEDMPDELRPAWNEQYNKLITNPIFFLKFFRCKSEFFESKKFPDFIASKLVKTEVSIDNDIPLIIFTPLQDGQENAKAKLILIDYDFFAQAVKKHGESPWEKEEYKKWIEKKEQKIATCIEKIMASYIPCSRIVFKDTFEDNRHAKTILESSRYDSLFSKYIIQDSNSNSIFTDNNDFDTWDLRKISTRNLENYKDINPDVLKIKTNILYIYHNCTLLFIYPRKCIKLFPNIYVNERDRDGNSALLFQMRWYMSGHGHFNQDYYQWFLKNIRALVKHDIHIDFFSESFKKNALHLAVELNDPTILTILSEGKLFHKALRQVNSIPHTPLDEALMSRERNKNVASFSKENNLEIIKFLLYNGAVSSMHTKYNQDIFQACLLPLNNLPYVVNKFLEETNTVFTAKEILENILKIPLYKDRLNEPYKSGDTPLDLAYSAKDAATIGFLEEQGAVSGHDENQGKNALHVFAQEGDWETLNALLQITFYTKSSNRDKKDKDGLTSLDSAYTIEDAHVISVLEKNGALSSKKENWGKNALHIFIEKNDFTMVLKLLELPFYQSYHNLNRINGNGETPLDCAMKSDNNLFFAPALKAKGAKTSAELKPVKLRDKIKTFLRIGLPVSVIGFLLYQTNKQYSWLSSVQRYINQKKR